MADPTSQYEPMDPIVSANFSSSVSRARGSRIPAESIDNMLSVSEGGEREPLLAGKRSKKPFYRPRPMWLVPFAIIASTVRGMTLAPRVQVFTQLSCNAIYGHDVYDHTSTNATLSVLDTFALPLHLSIDPAGPHLDRHSLGLFSTNIPPIYTQDEVFYDDDTDDDEPDPRNLPSHRCLQDPTVQSGAARIQTIMTTTMGTLSALTTGWWGHFGERHGRTRVLAASTLGLFLTDLMFILVSTPHSIFAAHGHKLLIVSPIIEGALGGWSTLQAATSAYISDCTSDGSRAHIFSRFSGVFYLGFSLGPALGAAIIRHPFLSSPATHSHTDGPNVHNGVQTVTSVFYFSAICSFVNLLLAVFLFPESLDKKKAKMTINRVPATVSEEGEDQPASTGWLSGLLNSLAVFVPKKIEQPGGGYRTDWSLTLLGCTLFAYLLSTGLFQIKYLYAEHIYGWGAEQLSYYISFVGGIRAVHLLFIMPFLIGTFKPKPKPKPAVPRGTSTSVPVSTSVPAAPGKKPIGALVKEMKFDLSLLRTSLILDFLSHALVSAMPEGTTSGFFVGATSLNSLGAGVIPAANSFALCVLQARGEDGAGKLFGALSVLQAVGQMIIGPMLFGLIYSQTVAQYPKAIFATAAGMITVALALLFLVRPDVGRKSHRKSTRAQMEVEIERGRSRVSKDIGSALISSASGEGTSSSQ